MPTGRSFIKYASRPKTTETPPTSTFSLQVIYDRVPIVEDSIIIPDEDSDQEALRRIARYLQLPPTPSPLQRPLRRRILPPAATILDEDSTEEIDNSDRPYSETRGSIHSLAVRQGSQGSTIYTEEPSENSSDYDDIYSNVWTYIDYGLGYLFTEKEEYEDYIEEFNQLYYIETREELDDEMGTPIPTFTGYAANESIITFLDDFELYAATKGFDD